MVVGQVNTSGRIESYSMLRRGLYFLIRSFSYTRQSIFPWHLVRTAKFLAKSRDLGLAS